MLTMVLSVFLCVSSFDISTAQNGAPVIPEKLASGKFNLSVKDEEVFLAANEADVREMLVALAKAAGVKFKSVGALHETKSINLYGVSVEEAVRRIAESYLLEFVKTVREGVPKLTAINAVPSRKRGMTGSKHMAKHQYMNLFRGDAVEIELAKKGAIHFASKAYGKVRFFDATTYYNPESHEEVYSFLFYRGEGPLPSRAEILKKVAELTKIRLEAEAQLSKLKGATKARARKKISNLWKNISQPESFVTVVSGAHTGHVPVITMTEGLPTDIVLSDTIKARLQDQYGGTQVRFVQPIYLGPFNTPFEFEINARRIFVDPHTGRETDKGFFLHKAATASEKIAKKMKTDRQAIAKYEERKSMMNKKWDFVRRLP